MTVFFVVLKTDLLPVEVSNDARIFQIFQYLKSESDVGHRILGRTLCDQYKYYKLKSPVALPRGSYNRDEIVQTCLHRSNWEEVYLDYSLDVLAPISNSNVCIVIQPRGDPTQTAIADLEANHGDIFSCLQITVSNLQRWTMQDVENNLEGGRLWPPGDAGRPTAIVAIEESLARHRTFTVMDSQAQQNKDYQHAREYKTHFRDIYQETLNSPGDVTNREFASFFHVLRCFNEDSYRIESEGSSALKASNFVVYFISPPLFSSYNEHFEFKQEKAWGFPIFLTTEGQPDAWCQFRPQSDLMVSLHSFLCPILISEVVSQNDEADRYRMLLQAIAVARAGQYLIRRGAQIQFFVVAIYLRANMIAERYIVANIGGTREVSIAQKDFTLTTADSAVAFLREMYNLVAMVDVLAENLDDAKKDILCEVKTAAAKVISLTSQAKQKKTGGTTLPSIPEGDRGDEPQDNLGVFGADDIQAILMRMNYKINFILVAHPLIASVSSIANESENGYLKFVREGRKEIAILQYLTEISSPENHTISGVQIWPARDGNVISMPVAGGWLTGLRNPDAHLWSVATQLFEAVGFMHQHGVAHMDLKPQNILIPRAGGRLSIIDFNRSLRVKGVGHKIRGIVGTTGYIAPEVAAGDGLYSAIRADLWSCGKTLEELCHKCRPSMDRDTLLEICRQLMDEDPEKRPTMLDVLERLARCHVDATIRRGSLSFYSVASPEVNA